MYRVRVLLCFQQFVRTVQCVASWNAQQHIIVLLLQTSIVSLLFIKWAFIGRKVLFLDCIFTQLWIGLARTEQEQAFPFLTVLSEGKWRVQTLEFLCFFLNGDVESLLHSALEQK